LRKQIRFKTLQDEDSVVCKGKFPGLICRPVAAQFMQDGVIALFAFEESVSAIRITSEKHYQLVPPEQVTEEDLAAYQQRPSD
jgi:hypothetical protein